MWTKTFGGINDDEGFSIDTTSDGGYIITGYTNSFGSGTEVWLLKTDANGDTLWTKTLGGSVGKCVQKTSDSGYIITGDTDFFRANGHDILLIKTDANGDSLWTKVFDSGGTDFGFFVQQTSDSGYVISGMFWSTDVWLIKTDASGDTMWTKTFGGFDSGPGRCVQQTLDGGYIITGVFTQNLSDTDVWLIKTDANGDTLWTKTFGGNSWDQGYYVQQTSDGGYIITGYTESFATTNQDLWLIKADANGDTLWTKTLGGTDIGQGYSVQQTSDGGYIITGEKNYDVWLIKVAPDVTSIEDNLNVFINGYQLQQNYPNPFNPSTAISFQLLELQNVRLDVFDILGRKVQTLIDGRKEMGLHEVQWDGTDEKGRLVTSGIYIYKLRAGSFEQSRKMVLLR